MSTPVIERPGTPGGRTRPQTRRAGAPRIPAQRGPGEPRRTPDVRRSRASRDTTGRAKFVLVVMVLLAAGLIATLWLSTAAAVDSYSLQEARQRTAALTEQSEALRKEVAVLESPASLAQRATAQGLVPVDDPARLVVAPDGRVDVVGEPEAATGAVPPPAPGGPAPAAPPGAPAAGAPADGAQADPQADPQAPTGARTAGDAAPGGPDEGAEREVPADTRAAGGQD